MHLEQVSLTETLAPRPPDPKLRHQTLRQSVKDAQGYGLMVGCGESFFPQYAVFLGSAAWLVGLLATLPSFLGACAQVWSLRLLGLFGSRLPLVVAGAALQGLSLLFIAALGFGILHFAGNLLGMALLALACVYFIAYGLSAPAWNSLIGDLMPQRGRAHFLAFRSARAMFATFLSYLGAGLLLQLSRDAALASWGFAAIFVFGFLARMRSVYALGQHENPITARDDAQHLGILYFLRHLRQSNFSRFVVFYCAVYFSLAIAGPYFAVYMLRTLHFNNLTVTSLGCAMLIAQFLSFKFWGHLIERHGANLALRICGFAVAIIPFFWLLTQNPLLIFAIEIYSGVSWSGFGLASQSYLFEAVPPQQRARLSAYQASLSGFCVLLGAVIGGQVIRFFESNSHAMPLAWGFANPYLLIFATSGVLRLVAVLTLLPKFEREYAAENWLHCEATVVSSSGKNERHLSPSALE